MSHFQQLLFHLDSKYLLIVSLPQWLNICLHDDVNERFEEVEDQPDVDHLDVGRGGQALGHADEQGGDDEEDGHVGRDEAFEEELLEVVGHVADDVDDQGRQEGGQHDAQQPPLDCHLVFKEKSESKVAKVQNSIEGHLNSHTPLIQLFHHSNFLDRELKQVDLKIMLSWS